MADGTNIENGKALFLLNKKGDSKDMKKTSKLIVLMLALCMALVPMLSACGNKTEEPDEGQNPIMNFVGTYGHDRATIVIGATDEQNGANATVTWASSAAENSEWVMSGTFDAERSSLNTTTASRPTTSMVKTATCSPRRKYTPADTDS